MEKMVSWTLSNVPPSSVPPAKILEIGSGNGNLLFALADAGYDPSYLAGIDYSLDAVKLARRIASERGGECERIVFEEIDFLSVEIEEGKPRGMPKIDADEAGEGTDEGWTLVLDKGTYDAMALSEHDEDGKRPCDSYPYRAAALLRSGGYYLINL